ncbi:MAG: GNAT family N-acetyltransferase [Candidatus Helarchaeota archaeon]
MSCRKAEDKDIDSMVNLWWKLHEYNSKFDKNYYAISSKEDALEYKRKYYKNIINDENFFISIIESEDERVVGYILGEVRERDPFYVANKFGRLHEASVDPNFQQKGLFIKAYLGFLKFLKEKDIDLVDAEMDLENSALAAYWKLNYYKRSFKLISWIKKTEYFIRRLEKRKKSKKKGSIVD